MAQADWQSSHDEENQGPDGRVGEPRKYEQDQSEKRKGVDRVEEAPDDLDPRTY
jgi:hypothetical protein